MLGCVSGNELLGCLQEGNVSTASGVQDKADAETFEEMCKLASCLCRRLLVQHA